MSENELVVEPAHDTAAAIPDWIGEEIPVPYSVAQDVRVALKDVALGVVPGKFVAEVRQNVCVLHTFLGHKANEALSKVLSFRYSSLGISVRSRGSAFGVLLEFSKTVAEGRLREILLSLSALDAERYLRANLLGSPLFLTRFVHVSKRFGLLRRDRDY